jgi:hypothetical protein
VLNTLLDQPSPTTSSLYLPPSATREPPFSHQRHPSLQDLDGDLDKVRGGEILLWPVTTARCGSRSGNGWRQKVSFNAAARCARQSGIERRRRVCSLLLLGGPGAGRGGGVGRWGRRLQWRSPRAWKKRKGEEKDRMAGLDPSGSGLGAATATAALTFYFLHHDG